MRKPIKFLGAIAVAGLVAAGGSAFTGTGLNNTANPAQFVGGTVTQTVTGATLSTVLYGYQNILTNTAVTTITLTFAEAADDLVVTALPSGAGNTSAKNGTFACTPVLSLGSVCTWVAGTDIGHPTDGYTGLDSVAITVAAA